MLDHLLRRFNREGDLLVTCGKDINVNLWWADNGERAGTFNGHNGAVWTTDMNCACCIFPTCMHGCLQGAHIAHQLA